MLADYRHPSGVPGYLQDRLQSVLHAAARLVNRTRKSTIQSLYCFGTCTGCGSQNALVIPTGRTGLPLS